MKRRIISIIAVVLVVAMMSTVLVACAPDTVGDAKSKMAEKYEVAGFSQGIISIGGLTGGLTAINKEDSNITVSAFYFESSDKAKAAFEKIENKYEEYRNDLKGEISAAKKAGEDDKAANLQAVLDGSKIKQSGKWIAFGHKKAVMALLGLF